MERQASARRLASREKNASHDLIPLQKTLFYLQCQLRAELAGGRHEAVLKKSLLTNARQGISDQHVYNPAAPVTRTDHDRTGGLLPRTSPMICALPPPGVWRKASRAASAWSGATTARNWPSLAMCKGSSPSSSQAPRTASRTGIDSSLKHDSQPAIARQFVERSGNAAARRIAHPANAGPSGLCQGFHQGKHGTRVRTKIGFQIEFAARQQNSDAVIADRSGKQNLVAGADGPRDRFSAGHRPPNAGRGDVHAIGFAVLDNFRVAARDGDASPARARRPWRALRLRARA